MLTHHFFVVLAAQLGDAVRDKTAWYIAIGTGDRAWDRNPPLVPRGVARLAGEVARKRVAPEDASFLNDDGTVSPAPTTRLRIRARFEMEEAVGTLRETGLFGNAGGDRDSGALLSYFVHPPIEKTADMTLERTILLDLAPRAAAGTQPTRYLGNSNSREVHDMENLSSACQVDEIRFDRRIYFATAEQAVEFGYDRCAYCFGRELSGR